MQKQTFARRYFIMTILAIVIKVIHDCLLLIPIDDGYYYYYFNFSICYYTSLVELMLIKVLIDSILQQYRIINEELHQITNRKTQGRVKKSKQSPEKVQKLISSHYELTMLAKSLNQIFGLPILATTATNFQMLTICAYFIINFSKTFGTYLEGITLISNYAEWCVIMLGHVWITASTWATLAREVRNYSLLK